MIRDATPQDFDALLTLAQSIPAFREHVFPNFDYSKTLRSFIMCTQFGYAKVVEHKGKIVGGCFGIIRENHWGEMCAFDLMTYSTYQTPQLLKGFYRWAKDNGADEVLIGNSYGSERYSQLIERLGFKANTQMFSRR